MSSGRETAIDIVCSTRDDACLWPGKIRDQPCDLRACSVAFDRHEVVHHVFQRSIGRVHVGIGGAGLDNVDGDAARSEITCQSFDHAFQCGLAGAVGCKASHRHTVGIG